MMMIAQKLELPCGVSIPNRLAKAAMSENMATSSHFPTEKFVKAYSRWVKGGTGLIITGNVMVDSRHRGEPNNVVIETGLKNEKELTEWASVIKGQNSHIWVQLNHPGKQSPKFLTKEPVAPSALPLDPPLDRMFNCPRELTNEEILDIIKRFAYAAEICKKCGFSGVQIHGAHGYLVSQFLSPKHNTRTDKWGGSLESRMNFVIEIYKAIRAKVGDTFPVGIKINSADFSKGGFSDEDAVFVARKLSEIGIDMIEISGGSYEKPVMMDKVKESTRKREAYFIEYAKKIKKVVKCPIMVTGGFRTLSFMETSLSNQELDVIGIARPLVLDPDLSNQLLSGQDPKVSVKPLTSGLKILDKIFPLEIIWYTMQIRRLGQNKDSKPEAGVYWAIFRTILDMGNHGLKRLRA